MRLRISRPGLRETDSLSVRATGDRRTRGLWVASDKRSEAALASHSASTRKREAIPLNAQCARAGKAIESVR